MHFNKVFTIFFVLFFYSRNAGWTVWSCELKCELKFALWTWVVLWRLTSQTENVSDICALMYLYHYLETFPCLIFFSLFFCLFVFFFWFNKSVDCCFTQGVDTISTDLLLALKSCSLARALTFSNTVPSFKGIYYCSKPVSLLFADFTQVHVHKTVI